jgi:hypothetical protein
MCDCKKEEWLFYNTQVQGYSAPIKIEIDRFCNGITVFNAGTTVAVFDDEQLQPGESKSISGNRKEIFVGRKDLSFQGAGVNLAYVTQKFYVKLASTDPHNVDVSSL